MLLDTLKIIFGVIKLFLIVLITLTPVMLKLNGVRKGLIAAALGIPTFLLSVVLAASKFLLKKLSIIK